jgi:aspartyl/asparaginyl beta-hydroxylase (cupin superfamily)
MMRTDLRASTSMRGLPASATTMFLDARQFPFTRLLESRLGELRREFEFLAHHQFLPWPESELYDRGWEVFGLWALGKRLDSNCRACPVTAETVESIPGLTTAGFSIMAPGTYIRPHVGYTNTVLRCHLGLIVPDGCGIEVDGETRHWEEGKCLVFDDTALHSAWNDSDSQRVILLIDFVRPGSRFDAIVSDRFATAIRALTSQEAAKPSDPARPMRLGP